MSGWTKMKNQQDEISGVTDWRLHDIRRTVGTNMAELKAPILTISRIFNREHKARLLLVATTAFIQPTARVRR